MRMTASFMAEPAPAKPTNQAAQEPDLPGPVPFSDQSEELGIQPFQSTRIDPQTCQQVFPHLGLSANTGGPVVLNLVGQGLLWNGDQEGTAALQFHLIDAYLIGPHGNPAVNEQADRGGEAPAAAAGD